MKTENQNNILCERTDFLLRNSVGLSKAIARAWKDDAFKARFFHNTKEALKELDLTLPNDLNFRLIEESRPNTLTFVLPDAPENSKDLSEEELQAIAKQTVLFLSTINAFSASKELAL